MRRSLLALIVAVLAGAACGADAEPTVAGDEPGDGPTAAVMAAALHQLATVDHTFGSGPPPFTSYLVQSATDPAAGDGVPVAGTRPLSDAERDAVEEALQPLGPVEFVDDADEWRTADLRPVVEGSVILGVGEPDLDEDAALVPVSLWCGGTCGTWLTYRVELIDGAWVVTGTEGPIAMS